jgi:hypothetical protein
VDLPIVIVVLVVLIALVTAILAVVMQRQNPGARGAEPGEGEIELHSEYTSGVGGGQTATWTVPRDPQAYAKHFIPRNAKK